MNALWSTTSEYCGLVFSMLLLLTALLLEGSFGLASITTATPFHLQVITGTAVAFVRPISFGSNRSNSNNRKRRLPKSSAKIPTAMASPASGADFTARAWKGGEAHEVLPKIFLGSMVSMISLLCAMGGYLSLIVLCCVLGSYAQHRIHSRVSQDANTFETHQPINNIII